MSDNSCNMCKGTGKNLFNEICIYCNGTGEWNAAAAAYIKNHICQCLFSDRKFCPVCNKKCHHDSTLSPKQKIVPGYGGISEVINSTNNVNPQQEEMISA